MNDYNYANRRNHLIQYDEYLGSMVDKLNKDSFYRQAKIRFSAHSNNHHFVERFIDRDLDITKILPIFYNFILRHRCEIVYYTYLENRPIRLELIVDGIVLGLSVKNHIFTFHTVFDRGDSLNTSEQVFQITNKGSL